MPVTQEGFSPEALEANFAQLAANPYPGRFIAQGLTGEGDPVQAYAIMGRSAGSQNRVFEAFADGSVMTIRTAPFETKPGEDHSLTIYNAMHMAAFNTHVVTNGEQTDDIIKALEEGFGAGQNPSDAFIDALNNWGYEPDKPNWTPRINGLFNGASRLSVLAYMKKDPNSFKIIRSVDERTLDEPGVGLCLHTYDGDGDPLPPFTGDPYFIPLGRDLEETADVLWGALDPNNRVSLAVKSVSEFAGAVILKNKHLGD